MPRNVSESVKEKAELSYIDRIRNVRDTESLGAIIGRFNEVVYE